ncbi:uncharacterized protein ACN427_013199 [Glossina fuscipes fuscipes]|nr:hypothetical protein GQX74_014140 [Glossina fuscipes]
MVNYQVQVGILLVALLGGHEVAGLSMWSPETAISSFQIGLFLSGINYYCYAIRSAREENAVEDETVANKSTIMELERDNEKIAKTNTDYSSNLTANVNAVENSIRASKLENADIDRKENQKVETEETIGPDGRTFISNSDAATQRRAVRNSKELKRYKK